VTFTHEELLDVLPQLRVYARALARNWELADDLVQDAIVNALKAEGQFRPGTSLRACLFTILRNRFVSVMARSPVTCPLDSEDADLGDRNVIRPEQESRIEVAAFKQAFASLPHRYREVLVLVGLHGLPQAEVAAICKCEIGTVKSRLSRAREQLRTMLLEAERVRIPSNAVSHPDNRGSNLHQKISRNALQMTVLS
jgi:RNA polymerase sigma-70 factor (ECF subfamily)